MMCRYPLPRSFPRKRESRRCIEFNDPSPVVDLNPLDSRFRGNDGFLHSSRVTHHFESPPYWTSAPKGNQDAAFDLSPHYDALACFFAPRQMPDFREYFAMFNQLELLDELLA